MARVSQHPQSTPTPEEASRHTGPPSSRFGSKPVSRLTHRRQRKERIRGSAMLTYLHAVIMHFSRRSTIHGLNHMAQAKSAKRRLFWIGISLIASFGFFVNMYYLIEKYIQREVLTNVLHDHFNFVYPDITFCLMNPIYFPPMGSESYNDLMETIENYKEFYNHTPISKLSDYLYMKGNGNYSHQSWSAIILCTYMQKSCTGEHFDVKFIWPYGNCYTFNATKMNRGLTREVKKSMPFNGLRPDFRVVVYKSVSHFSSYQDDPHDSLFVPSGIMVMIHEPNTYPLIGDSIIVDGCTQVDLKIVVKKHLNQFNKCEEQRRYYEYVDYGAGRNVTYLGRQSDCIFDKVQFGLSQFCKCQLHALPVPSLNHKLPFCFNGNFNRTYLFRCLNAFISTEPNLQECYKDLCEHNTYSKIVAYSKYPAVIERNTQMKWLETLSKLEKTEMEKYNFSDLAKKALTTVTQDVPTVESAVKKRRSDLLNVDFVERNFMMFRILPASLFMDLVQESEEYPLSRLMSDIGGCVGLWVGASLITIFEFVDLLMDFTEASTYRREKMRNSANKSGNKPTVNPMINNFSNGAFGAFSPTVIPAYNNYSNTANVNMHPGGKYNNPSGTGAVYCDITDDVENECNAMFEGFNASCFREAVTSGIRECNPRSIHPGYNYIALPEQDHHEEAGGESDTEDGHGIIKRNNAVSSEVFPSVISNQSCVETVKRENDGGICDSNLSISTIAGPDIVTTV